MSDTQETQRILLTAEEFVATWMGNNDYLKMGHIEFDKYINKVVFTNCVIIEPIIIDNVSNLPEIEINNCKINSISILNSETGNISINNDSEVSSITFEKTKVDDRLWIYNQSTVGDIFFKGSRIEHISIYWNAQIGNLWFIKKSKAEHITVRNNCSTGHLKFFGESQLRYVIISENVTMASISINEATIEEVGIENGVHINKIILGHTNINSRKLDVLGSIVEDFEFSLSNPYKIFIGTYESNGNYIYSEVHSIKFLNRILPQGTYLNISEAKINSINFESFVNDGTITLNAIQPIEVFDRLNINPQSEISWGLHTNILDLIIKNNHQPSAIKIIDSDLGNTQFIGCSIDQFQQFVFKNSKILDVFLGDTSIPHRSKITTINADEKEQRRLALGQFKTIYERQGDSVRAIETRAEEMEVYRNQLRDRETSKFTIEWWHLWGERLNLAANKTSTYHGKDWLRGAVVTLLSTAVFYTCYCLSRGIYPASPFNLNNLYNFAHVFAYFFEFLNPLHNTDFFEHIKTGEPNPGALIIDYVSRIVIAYTVYQTVQAFRKFGKKS